jgi:hypothetical protein
LLVTVSRDKWDIVLAGGRAVDRGDVIYVFTYDVDLGRHGLLGRTRAGADELVYLNWAPTQWDDPLEHMTVRVYYPIEVAHGSPDAAFLAGVGFRTEKWMNERYLIDYRTQELGAKRWLLVQLHRERIPRRYRFRVQQYVDARFFDSTARPAVASGQRARRPADPEERRRRAVWEIEERLKRKALARFYHWRTRNLLAPLRAAGTG